MKIHSFLKTSSKMVAKAAICLALVGAAVSCSYKKPAILGQTGESREKDSVWYLWYSSMTYGERMYVRVDTLSLLPEPNCDMPATGTLEKGTKLTLVDFAKIPTQTTDAWGNPTTMEITYAKVSYRGGEGWQLPSVLVKCTAPDNWTRFTPTDPSNRALWWTLGLSMSLALAYFIFRRRQKARAIENDEEPPALPFFAGVLYVIIMLLSLIYVFLQWGDAWDFFMRHFWAWSWHPFWAKAFVVLSVAAVPVIAVCLYEIWLNTKTVPKFLLHAVGIAATAVALCAATLITAWLMMLVAALYFTSATVDAYGSSQGGNTCPRCGHTWVKGQTYKCPNCGMV